MRSNGDRTLPHKHKVVTAIANTRIHTLFVTRNSHRRRCSNGGASLHAPSRQRCLPCNSQCLHGAQISVSIHLTWDHCQVTQKLPGLIFAGLGEGQRLGRGQSLLSGNTGDNAVHLASHNGCNYNPLQVHNPGEMDPELR